MKKADVVVLGAGIVGVCTALHLQKRGFATVLLDRRQPGEETSFGNAGLIERSSVFPYMFPRDWKKLLTYARNGSADAHYHAGHLAKVVPWLYRYWRNSSKDGAAHTLKANLPLIEHCLAEHDALAAEAGVSDLIRKMGFIRLSRSEAGFANAQRQSKLAAEYGVTHEVLSAGDVQRLEPHLSADIIGGLHLKETASVFDPHALTLGYLALFKRLGGRFEIGDARSLAASGTGWSTDTADGPLQTGACVVALGAWSRELAAGLGYALPLEIKRGYHMHYSAKGNAVLNHPVLDEERGYLLAPMAKGVRLTTGAEFAAINAPKTPVQLAQVEPVARALFPLDARRDAEPWMGRRPCFPDMIPLIGRAPKHERLWFACGHHHHGLTNAAVTGRLIGEMVAGSTPVIDPAPYRMERL